MLVALGILALALAFGVAWINTRIAGLIWVAANFLGYQWMVELSRPVNLGSETAVGLSTFMLSLLAFYLAVMSLSGIGAAYFAKRAARRAAA